MLSCWRTDSSWRLGRCVRLGHRMQLTTEESRKRDKKTSEKSVLVLVRLKVFIVEKLLSLPAPLVVSNVSCVRLKMEVLLKQKITMK